MIELERTFLAKSLPDLRSIESTEIIDIYIPKEAEHPTLRIRKMGDIYEMTKKTPVHDNDSSKQIEQTIVLSEDEFNSLRLLDGKITHKIRYFYRLNNKVMEIDAFQGNLKGLVLIDVEFDNEKSMEEFVMPDFCLCEVTQETFLAGGMLCGKTYSDIENDLNKFNYKKIIL